MTQKNVIIIRGASSSGKSTFAGLISNPCVIITADDYFYNEAGEYKFDASQLGIAHGMCRYDFNTAIKDPNIVNIVIANTNTKKKEWEYYSNKAEELGHRVFYIILEKRHENTNSHQVPLDVITRQANSIKENIKLS